MTQIKVSTGLLESLLGLGPLQVRIVGIDYADDREVHFVLESYIGEALPEGLMLVQVSKSIDTKLVPA